MNTQLYWGDLHSHCAISYGHGSLERALRIGQEYLDFCSVTGHASWPDMPKDRKRYGAVIDYHRKGFARLRRSWPEVQRLVAAYNHPGRFVTFLSYEWHSCAYGDHNVYYLDDYGELREGRTLGELHRALAGESVMIVPHHIGYGPGARGIDWSHFDVGRSPVVEVFSSHGSSERDGGPYPFYHAMGHRVYEGSLVRGLELGKRFGVIASTDHHAGYPGHYGAGLTAVYAAELTRKGIWDALWKRHCYAVTGDRIALDFSLNDVPMGGETAPTDERHLTVKVRGCDTIDRVEIYKNNRPLYRAFGPLASKPPLEEGIFKIRIEWGWGEKRALARWQGQVAVKGGEILSVEPCFRGESVLDPRDERWGGLDGDALPHRVTGRSSDTVTWSSHTYGNPHPFLAGTSSLILEVQASKDTSFVFDVNNRRFAYHLGELMQGSRRQFMREWLSEAVLVHRAVPDQQLRMQYIVVDNQPEHDIDVYYVRVAQENQQWAWSSPIWVPRVGS